MAKNMTAKTAIRYMERFQDKGFVARVRKSVFTPGFHVLVSCSAPLLMEGLSGGRQVVRNLGRHNTSLSAYTFHEARSLIRRIDTGEVGLPE